MCKWGEWDIPCNFCVCEDFEILSVILAVSKLSEIFSVILGVSKLSEIFSEI